ncbi:hypothetical protein ILYODFUR_028172 [Ilyodon furcidens]|uniref:Uncharacterized protein n=1 Tax=Ilyodon furcidens TaxID=33524 RepID=A0ABV0U949_9TELE
MSPLFLPNAEMVHLFVTGTKMKTGTTQNTTRVGRVEGISEGGQETRVQEDGQVVVQRKHRVQQDGQEEALEI